MCTDPVLLCLDEPAAGLNPRESAELGRYPAHDPRRARDLDPADRARHVGGDGDFRPRRRARLRRQDRRRHAGGRPQRSEGDRRLSRRRGRRGRRRSRGGGRADDARRSSRCAASRPITATSPRCKGVDIEVARRRDRGADRRQRRRQIDPDDDDLRQSARARGPHHLRRPRHHAAADARDRPAARSRSRRKAGASSCA